MKPTRPWLLPLVPIYRLGQAVSAKRAAPPRKLRWPVISIGNLSTGGAGKTPLAITLAKALTARGLHVDVLSRGYRRKTKIAQRVNPNGTADQFGDEPLLIARDAGVPVYVAANRYEAGLLAETTQAELDAAVVSQQNAPASADTLRENSFVSGHDFSRADSHPQQDRALAPEGSLSPPTPTALHLLDDGFQHRRLARNIDILLLNRDDWTDTLLPAGNLREPLKAAHRATVIAIPSDDLALESELKTWGWQGPIWRLHRRMVVPRIAGPIAAFCGIARPDQFFAGLEAAGLHIASRTAFADHHRYDAHDIHCLLDAAQTVAATALITTEKDRARLGNLAATLPDSIPLLTANLHIEIEDQPNAIDWLLRQCDSKL